MDVDCKAASYCSWVRVTLTTGIKCNMRRYLQWTLQWKTKILRMLIFLTAQCQEISNISPTPNIVYGLHYHILWVILWRKLMRMDPTQSLGLKISASKSASGIEKRTIFDPQKLFWGCGRLTGTLFRGFEQKKKKMHLGT